jgi:ribonuclease HIII
VLNDIAEDPNDYTFKEINQALETAFKDEGTVPIKIDSSGKVIHLGNNTQEELKKVNAILERYGYEKIPEGMDDVATR